MLNSELKKAFVEAGLSEEDCELVVGIFELDTDRKYVNIFDSPVATDRLCYVAQSMCSLSSS